MRISFVGLGWYRLAARLAGAMLIVAAVVLAMGDARAQSVARGQAIYAQLGCNSATCHGADPAANMNQLLNGANSAAAIEYAATTRSDIQSLRAAFDLDPTLAV